MAVSIFYKDNSLKWGVSKYWPSASARPVFKSFLTLQRWFNADSYLVWFDTLAESRNKRRNQQKLRGCGMRAKIMMIGVLLSSVVVSGCATKTYGRVGDVTDFERQTMTCREIDLEMARTAGFMQQVSEESEFSGRDVLAPPELGDMPVLTLQDVAVPVSQIAADFRGLPIYTFSEAAILRWTANGWSSVTHSDIYRPSLGK